MGTGIQSVCCYLDLSRAAEIWQYIYVTNSAASTYLWDYVANYDYTFRQLMSCNPSRSWAKIYNQMWNLSMKDFIPRNSFGGSARRDHSQDSHSANGGSFSAKKSRKPKYCWAYNRGNCKDSSRCKFVHRRSYCDVEDHANNTCIKKPK